MEKATLLVRREPAAIRAAIHSTAEDGRVNLGRGPAGERECADVCTCFLALMDCRGRIPSWLGGLSVVNNMAA